MSMVRNMMKKLTETKWTGVVLAGAGILMMIFGIYRGEMSVVFTKAVNICMECIFAFLFLFLQND